MMLLILFAFLAGVVTILSPCILPILPIILSTSVGNEKVSVSKPVGVVLGFIGSFTFFTLFLSSIVRLSGIPAESLRIFSIIIIAGFGISLLIPHFQLLIEKLFSSVANIMPKNTKRTGFGGGLLLGFSIGLLWTPCVGPILASVISLAIVGTVTTDAVFITLAYSLGTAIPMFLIIWGGQNVLHTVPWLVRHTATIQKLFGVIMVLTAIAIYFNIDRAFQTYILSTFPRYGTGITQIEDNDLIRKQLEQQKNQQVPKTTETAPSITAGGEWLNMPTGKTPADYTIEALQGKIVLIDFWTYTCINCQRTLPYLRTWHEKYADKGLVIIGVHSPEFEFEKDPKNVQDAIADFKIPYVVVQDNDFATWRSYDNHYWPAKYLIDATGTIRYEHFGEGAYDETERKIQELLREAGSMPDAQTITNPTNNNVARTPELYLGYGRIEYLASPEQILQNTFQTYSAPIPVPDNRFAYEGNWIVTQEYANPQKGARLYLQYDAKDVFLVMNPKTKTASVSVFLDGKPAPNTKHVQNGVITVDKDQLYEVISLPSAGKHELRLEYNDANVELFAFTFG